MALLHGSCGEEYSSCHQLKSGEKKHETDMYCSVLLHCKQVPNHFKIDITKHRNESP